MVNTLKKLVKKFVDFSHSPTIEEFCESGGDAADYISGPWWLLPILITSWVAMVIIMA